MLLQMTVMFNISLHTKQYIETVKMHLPTVHYLLTEVTERKIHFSMCVVLQEILNMTIYMGLLEIELNTTHHL